MLDLGRKYKMIFSMYLLRLRLTHQNSPYPIFLFGEAEIKDWPYQLLPTWKNEHWSRLFKQKEINSGFRLYIYILKQTF